MDVSLFREFAELVMQGSYTSAAQKLNLSQPTLSRHIDALERELNAELVADVLPIRLTAEGSLVLQTALRMNDLFAQLQTDLANLQRSGETFISIHNIPALGLLSSRIMQAASQTMDEFPYSGLDYATLRAGVTPEQAVATGSCDLSFVQLVDEHEVPNLPDGVSATELTRASGRIVLGVPINGPLASASSLRLRELEHETLLFPALKTCEAFKDSLLVACRKRGVYPMVRMAPCRHFEEFYLLNQGNGVFALSEGDLASNTALAHDLKRRQAIVPLAPEDELRARWFVLHRSRDLDGSQARFVAALASA